MKTKCYLLILCISVILPALSFAYESQLSRGRNVFELGAPNHEPISVSTTESQKLRQRISGAAALLSSLGLGRSFRSSTLVTPPSMRPGQMQADSPNDPDVSVTCSASDFVVRVRRAFYGLGADAQELTLGSDCKSNGDLGPHGDLLFKYPLTSCDAVRELPRGFLVYKYVLHYEPSSKRFPSRALPIDVSIECHYQRDYSVHQLAVQPTWQTVIVRKKLKGHPMDFQIRLMDDSWKTPAKTHEYLLGQTVNVQVSNPHLSPGEKLYINVCYAAPSSDSKSSLRYTVIDNFGCMLDSKQDPGASEFISRTDKTLRFSLKAFQFTADPDTEVSIHCKLLVTSEDPGPAHKSCTYRGHRWRALAGHDSICECCESKCVTSKHRRALKEGSASSGPLLVSDQPYTVEDDLLPVSPSAASKIEDKTNRNDYTQLNSPEKIWENGNVEKYADDKNTKQQFEERETILGADPEPDLEKLDYIERVLEDEWSEPKVRNFNMFREDGSGGDEGEDFSEISEEHMSHENQEEGELLHHGEQLKPTLPTKSGLQRELEPPDCEEENKKHACRVEEDGTTASVVQLIRETSRADVVNEEEKTWYFTWR
ncbi:zona pellucida sperm-binding protein 3 [Melanotaenia boesemani]|uniref:zona pellucida sperm-binding protein 3 n=1 Tax=Melanotaenia boesemani TaxID=1250792 RepID=UPI001C04047B|nr:zona pellucida sperm-binding protein 3 [Melanotaenia boesemani]